MPNKSVKLPNMPGISDKTTTFGIFNYSNINDVSDKLLAQIVWYFLDGVGSRKGDFQLEANQIIPSFEYS